MAEIKTNVMRILDKKKIPYKTYTYETGDSIDGVSVAHKLNQPLEQVFKTLVTKGKSNQYFVFVIPVAQELNLKVAAKVVGEKAIEMIPVKDMNQVTGYIRGGCSPIGMKKQFQTVIHESAKQVETMIISGGKIGFQVELSPMDLATLIRAKFGNIIL
ncbi:MAG: Cys-tRNA(Pro) deacylase [Firmicutes bacterium]|uniref:Cys-tRNA(Pro)/Cys-tRNA(Cys) deacylase n=1 Tax=Candidatus Scybalomonas excrementavium TaxID=2840943 RepID=A0A9D9HYB2_9FIRM|nr:Cys-tRNA(Pro) deacylase [Candidatus Scybalomonas excrementavium]